MKSKLTVIAALFLSALILFPRSALMAEEQQGSEKEKKKEKLLSFSIDGFYRLRWTHISEMDAFPEGPVPVARYWDQRWQIAPEVTLRPNIFILKRISLHTLANLYDGSFGIQGERSLNLWQDNRTWNQRYLGENGDWKSDGFWWREYWGEIDFTAFIIRVGQMGSTWGQGILANNGNGFKNDFGDDYFGDIVDRVLIGTKPIDLITGGRVKTDFMIAVAYDWLVIEDATGQQKDHPKQYLFAMFKEPEKETGESIFHDLMVGLYYVSRSQDMDTTANVVDGTFRLPVFLMEKKLKLALCFEGVYIWGHTDANQSLNAPEGSDVEMYGFMTSLAAETKRLDLITELGLASGDPNPFDDQVRDFHFNRDYNVGLILFERVLAAATANTSYQFASPSLSAQPPAGIDQLPTNGSVTNAFYVYPRLKMRPIKGSEIILGLLYAQAPADLVDPYRSFLNGGVATNYNGGPASADLGWEFDVGASYTAGNVKKRAIRFGGQWGWFWPGDAFNDAAGNKMDTVELGQFRFDILY